MLSPAVEDYLKAIYKLQNQSASDHISTGDIAAAMEVSAASATNMVKRLAEFELIEYESYKGARLTDAGRKVALEVIRHHRLLELYLKEVLDYPWEEVHREAEQLEHHISETFESKIEELLGYPTRDPHGHPIPSREGVVDQHATRPLTELDTGTPAVIDHLSDEDPALLRLLEQRDLLPDTHLEVVDRKPLEGLLTVTVEGHEQLIGYRVALKVFVRRLDDHDGSA
jgi:DtxR family Mn-dependent transcriptional regulator